MEAFIDGRCAISPQNTFGSENFLKDITSQENIRSLKCIEPQYSQFIDPMASRRMSRIIKMGITAAVVCLREAGIVTPDAIVCGTGLGCMEDTEKFLRSLIESGEGVLNPTPFINSTHNTVTASIAIFLKCYGYNNTFSHRGFSFESALTDSMMLLNEGSVENVLVGGSDELTRESFNIMDRLGLWKKKPLNNLHLFQKNSKGSLPGEGTAFFLLNRKKTSRSIARILSVSTFYGEKGITDSVSSFVEENLGKSRLPDLIIAGVNGDSRTDWIYYQLMKDLFDNKPSVGYKHLSGEYDTSSAFALYLATCLLKDQYVPEMIRVNDKPAGEINTILIYNHLSNFHHSMILLSSC